MAFLAWRSIEQAISVPGSSIWAVPIIFFSFFLILAYLDIIVIRRVSVLQWLFFASISLSFIFVHNLMHLSVVFLAHTLWIWGVVRIEDDLRLNIRISLWKSIHTGSSLILLATVFLITSQYYWTVRNFESIHLIPQFDISSMSGNLTSRILATINPGFKNMDQDGLTIDQLILQIQEGQDQEQKLSGDMNAKIDQMIEKNNPTLTLAQKKSLKEAALKKANSTDTEIKIEQDKLIVQAGRKKFSEMAGVELTGNEKASDIFSDVVNRKINQYLGSGLADSENSSPLPIVMAVGLFLTIWPLGSFLNIIWVAVVKFFLWILIKLEFIFVKKVVVEMEVIME